MMKNEDKKIKHILSKANLSYSENNFLLAIPRFMSLAFIAYCSMREDLLLILEYLQKLDTNNDKVIDSSLSYSIIALYGKCFTDSNISKSPKLEPLQIFSDNAELKKTHDYLMDLRHNFISHRGYTESEVTLAYLVVPKEDGEPQVRFSGLKQISFNNLDKQNIRILIEYLLDFLKTKIQKSGEKTYVTFMKDFTPEQLTYLIFNNTLNNQTSNNESI